MKKIAIIDIGSNSVRLVLFEIYKNYSFRVIDDLKESPRLGEDLLKNGHMKQERMDQALNALKLFKQMCNKAQVDKILAFGTAAVRSAENANEFLERVHTECNLDVKVLSGVEEATHSFYGAINSMDIKGGVLIDIGGASTEVVYFENREIKKAHSFLFGSVTLGQRFKVDDVLDKSTEKEMKKYITEEYSKIPWLKELEGKKLIGVGGTIRNLAKIHSKNRNYSVGLIHNYHLTNTDIKEIYNFVKKKSSKEKQNIEGLAKSRADIFVGATCAVNELINYAQLDGVLISGKGIREGVLYKHFHSNGKEIYDVFNYSLFNTCEQYNINRVTVRAVYQTFVELFHKFQELHQLDHMNIKIARTLTFLYESGININYYDNDIHSYYAILNSRLDGISHKELLIAALASSLQNKRNLLYQNHLDILDSDDIRLISIYGLLLRFAKTFNRTHGHEVEKINIDINDERVFMTLWSKDNIELEVKLALNSKKRFQKVFKRKLFIEQGRTSNK